MQKQEPALQTGFINRDGAGGAVGSAEITAAGTDRYRIGITTYTTLILAGLVLQGVVPGPRLYLDNYDLVQFILLILLLTNILIVVLGLAGLRLWTRVLVIPESLLVGGVVVLATVGTYTTNNSALDLVIMVTAGMLGAVMRLAKIPITPLIIGFVLAPMLEVNLRQALVVYQGNWNVFFDRPIAGILLGLTVVAIVYPYVTGAFKNLRARRA